MTRELIERLRSMGTALFRPDHPAALVMWEAAERIDVLEGRLRGLHEALTPSAETKAAYIGEFSFTIDEIDGDVGVEVARKIDVPWTTVKQIMAAIIGRAALHRP